MPDDKVTAAARKLAAAKARARRRAMGPPLKTPPDSLDALAAVGPEDAGEIEGFIRDSAGAVGVGLFRAEADEDG